MKNSIIGILVVALLGLGGFVLYDKAQNKPSAGNSSQGSESPQTSTVTGKTLDFTGKGLTEVGPDVYKKTDTVVLVLSDNKLKSLKSEMGAMTKLEVLRVDHNQLEGSLIGEIRKMPLRELDASYNKLTGIPAEVGQLSKLETLDLSYNNIDSYPNEIANIPQLKTLKLTGNPMSADKIAELKSKLPNTTVEF